MEKRGVIKGVVLVGLLWLLPPAAEGATITLSCSPTATIQDALKGMKAGDVLLVSGACNENVVLGEGRNDITLDGQGLATINGADPTRTTLTIRGRGIGIKRFTITGGQDGINVNSGGTALIDSNVIRNTGRRGIQVGSEGLATIINNTIQDNAGEGIFVNENSTARIGFSTISDSVPSPNTIQGNGGNGVSVARSSNARIVGNVIANNGLGVTGDGIAVFFSSHADIAANTINGNGRDGIRVSDNSGVNLGRDTTTTFFDEPNSSAVKNAGFGIRCFTGAYADGRIGTLNGNSGAKSFASSCIDSLI